MANAMKVAAEPREVGGTSHVRRLRRGGVLPGVVYSEGAEGLKIQVNEHIFNKALKTHHSEHLIMDLDITGQATRKVLLQEVQHHPISGKIIHVDFHEISMTKKLRLEIPIKLVGEPVGVTQQGGVIEYLIRAVQVECLPSDIVEHIDVDVTKLDIGDRLTVGDIALDMAKYSILTNKDIAIAAVTAPREEEVVAEPEVVAGAGEPEVLREKKEEGEEAPAEGGKEAKGASAKDGKGAPPAKESKGAAPAAKDAKAAPAAKEGKK
ncbi:MAG: 50S ribosomal protein L25 [bacterium]